MKKKVVLVTVLTAGVIVALYILLGVIGVLPFPKAVTDYFNGSNQPLTDYQRIALMMADTYPTDLVILGEAPVFEEVNVSFRTVDSITEDTIKTASPCEYTFLVINDLDDTVTMTDEAVALLREKIATDTFCLFYLGEKYATVWDDKENYLANVDGNRGFRYFSVNGQPRRVIGEWGTQEQTLQQEYAFIYGNTILIAVESYLQEVN